MSTSFIYQIGSSAVKRLMLVVFIASGCVGITPKAHAEQATIGLSMANLDAFLSRLLSGVEVVAKANDINLIVRNSGQKYEAQRDHVKEFIEMGVDAIILGPVIMDSTVSFSSDVEIAGIPMVYINSMPINVNMLPSNQAFVASNEVDSGTFQAEEVCRLMEGRGKAVVMMGELTHNAALQRTKDVNDVFSKPECSGIEIVAEQTADWSREKAENLLNTWLSAGLEFQAIIANNDEMAIGAINALKADRRSTKPYIIAGIDATPDGLAAMRAGDLDVTVFQNAKDQGRVAVETAMKLINGENTEKKIWVPFELVTPENMSEYIGR